MDASGIPSWLSIDDLASSVHQHLGRDDATITCWTAHRLVGGGEGLGVWRLSGTAQTAEATQLWSLILKGWPPEEPSADPSAWNWPHREQALYRSGLLTALPSGIQAPTCYGDIEGPDGSVWLWLEEITDQRDEPWPPDRYAVVARHLGQFNGAYLAGHPLPEAPWLSRNWLRHWVAAAGPSVTALSGAAGHPLVGQVYPPWVVEAYTRLWDERDAYYAVLGRAPQAFCHLDAFRRNLFMRQGRAEREETVLIDWGFAGIAGLGEELASLVAASILYMAVPVSEAQHLQAMVLASYIEGLGDQGWNGEPGVVETGYRIAAGLRFGVGLVRQLVAILGDEQLHPYLEQLIGRPLEEIVVNLAAMNAWLVDLIAEVHLHNDSGDPASA